MKNYKKKFFIVFFSLFEKGEKLDPKKEEVK